MSCNFSSTKNFIKVWGLQNYIDLATIQEYLDHGDALTTQRYIHKPRKNIVDAVLRLSAY